MNRRGFFSRLAALFAAPAIAKIATQEPTAPSSGRVEVLGRGSQMRVIESTPRSGPAPFYDAWCESDAAHINIRSDLIREGVLPDWSKADKDAFRRHRLAHLNYIRDMEAIAGRIP